MGEFLGRDVVRDGDVGLPTVNGYAYYRYSRAGMLRSCCARPPRRCGCSRVGHGAACRSRWREQSHPRYARSGRGLGGPTARRPDRTPSCSTACVELLDAGTEYYTAVQTIIPMAASSETIFTGFYERLVRRARRPAGRDVPARLRQRADPRREVAVRPADLGARARPR